MVAEIAVEDFGTGFASLSSLQSFPFEKIKTGPSFQAWGLIPSGAHRHLRQAPQWRRHQRADGRLIWRAGVSARGELTSLRSPPDCAWAPVPCFPCGWQLGARYSMRGRRLGRDPEAWSLDACWNG